MTLESATFASTFSQTIFILFLTNLRLTGANTDINYFIHGKIITFDMNKKKLFVFLFVITIFTVSLLFRLRGLISINPPFWVDEIFTASQANVILKYGLNVFNNSKIYFEYHNISSHFLVALFFKIFGQNEWAARLPFVIIGSLVPVAAFVFSRFIFGLPASIISSLLISFSYIEIVWSRQARGYVLQQLLVLAAFYLYFKIISYKKNPVWQYLLLSFVLILGILTHTMFYLVIASLLIHYLVFNSPNKIKLLLKSRYLYLFIILGVLIIYLTGVWKVVLYFYNAKVFFTNNLWYYHSFLWREYGLISFLAIIGLLIGFKNKFKETVLIFIYLVFHLLFLSFIFKPYVSRYLLPIFPLLFILAGYALTNIQRLFYDRSHIVIAFLISLFFIANGDKFVNRPKMFYSVNHDFREIALIDYHQLYQKIKEKISNDKQVAIIETLPDRAQWYLGYDYEPLYLFRWTDEEGLVNGLQKRTVFFYNDAGEKIITPNSSLRIIGNLNDLKKAINKYGKGFIFIDDSSLPQDVIKYAQSNLKKELYLDRYYLDDNPYSIWPATLYSWGFN